MLGFVVLALALAVDVYLRFVILKFALVLWPAFLVRSVKSLAKLKFLFGHPCFTWAIAVLLSCPFWHHVLIYINLNGAVVYLLYC